MRQGLVTVVPESVLALLTWGNLERGVCGERDISLAHLKTACEYVHEYDGMTFVTIPTKTWLLQWFNREKMIDAPQIASGSFKTTEIFKNFLEPTEKKLKEKLFT